MTIPAVHGVPKMWCASLRGYVSMKNIKKHKNRGGFTLIELMVVIAMLGILSGMTMPHFGEIIHRAQASKRRAQAEGFRKACALYYAEHNDWPTSGGNFHCFAAASE